MIRRINWKLGDNVPDSGNISLNVSGTGTIQISTGFDTSSAMVAFSRTYTEQILDVYGQMADIYIEVESVNEDGFVLSYENVPSDMPLDINYTAI
jgi:hypothetical protein